MYGTLAGFQPSRYEVQSQACANFGIEVTPDGILRGYAAADAYMSELNSLFPIRLRTADKRDEFFAEYERLVLSGSGVNITAERALKIFRRLSQIPYKLVPFDDVAPTLKQLKSRGLTLGLISNIDRDSTELAESLGLTAYLDLHVTSIEVGANKPDPAIFHAALTKAKARSEETVHVGDQPKSDIEGALTAGIRPVLLDRDGNHVDFTLCSRIESLLELPTLLEKLSAF
uniref:Predicted hydrolase (Had superfamily) n=1 Tax=uncultured Chloroflexi bacterium HF0500_03M05 TaxID=710737 RepID=E0XY74_9CHLR|nr:predicted hydrolase (had superfamily) [uncultured Chloroflexi bacterium HF0500_03M05]